MSVRTAIEMHTHNLRFAAKEILYIMPLGYRQGKLRLMPVAEYEERATQQRERNTTSVIELIQHRTEKERI